MNWHSIIINHLEHVMNILRWDHVKMQEKYFYQAANVDVMLNCQIITKKLINVMSLVWIFFNYSS